MISFESILTGNLRSLLGFARVYSDVFSFCKARLAVGCRCAGEEFFTDANSLEMVQRQRFHHTGFQGAPVQDEEKRNERGGNYYPITSAMMLRDNKSHRHLTLVTDRGQG